ncbi:MAG: hypothetical protein Kow00106_17470 [Anaerolineae bacterium]
MTKKLNTLIITLALIISMIGVLVVFQSPVPSKAGGVEPDCVPDGCGCSWTPVICKANGTSVYPCGTCDGGQTLYCVPLAAYMRIYDNGEKYTWGGWGSDIKCGNSYWPTCQTTCQPG